MTSADYVNCIREQIGHGYYVEEEKLYNIHKDYYMKLLKTPDFVKDSVPYDDPDCIAQIKCALYHSMCSDFNREFAETLVELNLMHHEQYNITHGTAKYKDGWRGMWIFYFNALKLGTLTMEDPPGRHRIGSSLIIGVSPSPDSRFGYGYTTHGRAMVDSIPSA